MIVVVVVVVVVVIINNSTYNNDNNLAPRTATMHETLSVDDFSARPSASFREQA